MLDEEKHEEYWWHIAALRLAQAVLLISEQQENKNEA